MTPENTIAAIIAIYPHASTFPCRVTTAAGAEWIMKLRGSGPGPMALATELIALRAARAMGLDVPAPQSLYLPPGFPWTIGSDEFDGIIQRSFGWNLGVELIGGARVATLPEIVGADSDFRAALAQVDCFLTNVDRTRANPNILAVSGRLVAIDFDACLFLRRAVRGYIPDAFALPAGHLLGNETLLPLRTLLEPELLRSALSEVPQEWLESLHIQRERLEQALLRYAEAWNMQQRLEASVHSP